MEEQQKDGRVRFPKPQRPHNPIDRAAKQQPTLNLSQPSTAQPPDRRSSPTARRSLPIERLHIFIHACKMDPNILSSTQMVPVPGNSSSTTSPTLTEVKEEPQVKIEPTSDSMEVDIIGTEQSSADEKPSTSKDVFEESKEKGDLVTELNTEDSHSETEQSQELNKSGSSSPEKRDREDKDEDSAAAHKNKKVKQDEERTKMQYVLLK